MPGFVAGGTDRETGRDGGLGPTVLDKLQLPSKLILQNQAVAEMRAIQTAAIWRLAILREIHHTGMGNDGMPRLNRKNQDGISILDQHYDRNEFAKRPLP